MASNLHHELVLVPGTSELPNCQDLPPHALAPKIPNPTQPDGVKSPSHRDHLHTVATANASSASSSSTSSSSSSSCMTGSSISSLSSSSGGCVAQRTPAAKDAARPRGKPEDMAATSIGEVGEVSGPSDACEGQRKFVAQQPPCCDSVSKHGCFQQSPFSSSSSVTPSPPNVGEALASAEQRVELGAVCGRDGAAVSSAWAGGVNLPAVNPGNPGPDARGRQAQRGPSSLVEVTALETESASSLRKEHVGIPVNHSELQQQLPQHQLQQQMEQQQPQQTQQQQQQTKKPQLQQQQQNQQHQLQHQQQKLQTYASRSREVGTMTSPWHTQQLHKRDAETQATQAAPSRRSVATSPKTPPSGTSPVHVYPEVNLGDGGKKGSKPTRVSKKSCGSGSKGCDVAAAADDDEEDGSGDEGNKSPVREVRWDDKGMTWEVYGASMDVEVLGLAIQKHLEQQIEQHSRERSTRSDSTVAATQPIPQQRQVPQQQQQPPPLQKQQQQQQASQAQAQLQPLPLQSLTQQQPGAEEAKGRMKRSRHSAVLRTVLQNVRQPRCCTRANSIAE